MKAVRREQRDDGQKHNSTPPTLAPSTRQKKRRYSADAASGPLFSVSIRFSSGFRRELRVGRLVNADNRFEEPAAVLTAS